VGAFGEWENYAPWVERYYDLTGDKRTGERIALWGDAYLAGWGDMCSTWGAKEYVNILAYAYFVSGDAKYLRHGMYVMNRYIGTIVDAPGTLYDGFPHLAQMSHGPGYMAQRIPYFLAALARHGKPVEPEMPHLAKDAQFTLFFTRLWGKANVAPPTSIPPRLQFVPKWPKKRKIEVVNARIRENEDTAFRIVAPGSVTYAKHNVTMTVQTPAGKIIEKRFDVKRGEFTLELDVPLDGRTGVYKVAVWTSGSMWGISSGLRTEPELNLVFPLRGAIMRFNGCRYHFMVPKGTRAFAFVTRPFMVAPYSFGLYGPDGEAVTKTTALPGRDLKPKTVRVPVKPGHAGKVWSFEGYSGYAYLEFKGEGAAIPQYFATRPEAWFEP